MKARKQFGGLLGVQIWGQIGDIHLEQLRNKLWDQMENQTFRRQLLDQLWLLLYRELEDLSVTQENDA